MGLPAVCVGADFEKAAIYTGTVVWYNVAQNVDSLENSAFCQNSKNWLSLQVTNHAMKKFLLLLAAGAILFAGCGKEDDSQGQTVPWSIDATCTCGTAYHLVYNIQEKKSSDEEAASPFKEYPSGKSTMWTLTCNGKAYPLTTYMEGDINEGYCQWTCSCGKTLKVMEKDCLYSDDNRHQTDTVPSSKPPRRH